MDSIQKLLFEEIKLSKEHRYTNIKKTFGISLHGFMSKEKDAIDRILNLTNNRCREYAIQSNGEFQIIIANDILRDNNALNKSNVPVVWITNDSKSNNPYFVTRPITAKKLLRVLDTVTMQQFHYLPELNVGDKSIHNHPEIIEKIVNNHGLFPSEQIPEPGDSHPAKVLVVDDSRLVRKQLGLLLLNLGIKTDFAANGNEALDQIENNNYELIFMDVIMPEVDGIDAAKIIRKKFGKGTPIVLMSARDSQFNKIKGNMAGCKNFLTKPVNQQELFDVISKHISCGIKNPASTV